MKNELNEKYNMRERVLVAYEDLVDDENAVLSRLADEADIAHRALKHRATIRVSRPSFDRIGVVSEAGTVYVDVITRRSDGAKLFKVLLAGVGVIDYDFSHRLTTLRASVDRGIAALKSEFPGPVISGCAR
jgi:hypothetical protein